MIALAGGKMDKDHKYKTLYLLHGLLGTILIG